jgi:hypothetical protein
MTMAVVCGRLAGVKSKGAVAILWRFSEWLLVEELLLS